MSQGKAHSIFRYVERNLVDNLRSRLTRQVVSTLEVAQSSMLDKIGQLLPEEERGFIELTPHNIPLDVTFTLDGCSNIFTDFKEDVEFNFTLSPTNVLWHSKKLQLRARNFLLKHNKPLKTVNSNMGTANPKNTSELHSNGKRLSVNENSTSTVTAANELACVAGGMALTSISDSTNTETLKIALSAALVYSALYVCERAMWTLTAREQQFKTQFIKHAMERMPMLEDPLAIGIRQQIHRELTTLLGVACGTVESLSENMKGELSKWSDNIESLEETIKMSSMLAEKAQDIQDNFDRLNQRFVILSS